MLGFGLRRSCTAGPRLPRWSFLQWREIDPALERVSGLSFLVDFGTKRMSFPFL
jgi:hypothetical protein